MERHPADQRGRVSAGARQEQCVEAAFQPEHVLDRVYDARFSRAALAADVLEVLPPVLVLQARLARVEERCR
jgi:hypothetical protein